MMDDRDFRRRLFSISVSSLMLTLSNTAWDVLGPLWASGELHLEVATWASIRSIRFAGTFFGTFIIAVAANAWGPKAVGIVAFLVAGISLAFIAAGGDGAIYAAIPFFGAAISAVYVSLNIGIQLVGRHLQVKANSLYRSVAAAVAIVAPILATTLAGQFGYRTTFFIFALLLATGALCLTWHPSTATNPSRASLVGGFAKILRRPGLLRFLAIEQGFGLATVGVGVFAALRLSRDFGSPDALVGAFMTLAALSTFLGTLASIRVQERLGIRKTLLLSFATIALSWIGFGIAPSLAVSVTALVVGSFAGGLASAPVSYSVARLGGAGSEATTITFWKLVQALTTVVGMRACALLEPGLGMSGIIIWGSLAAILPLALLARSRMEGLSDTGA
jgi:predicted MFS family arabinose efflux permease